MFILYESKTGFCHVFYSFLPAYYFQLIEVKPGVFHSQTQDYFKARGIARRYVGRCHETLPMARRSHLLLKEEDPNLV